MTLPHNAEIKRDLNSQTRLRTLDKYKLHVSIFMQTVNGREIIKRKGRTTCDWNIKEICYCVLKYKEFMHN